MRSHAANPTALLLKDGKVRIYFSSRAKDQRASIGWAVFDLNKPEAGPLSISKKPVLEPGIPGLFDDCGVSVSSLIWRGKLLYMYYMGWSLAKSVPWKNSIGLAISRDGGLTFKKYSSAPIMDRSKVDPFSLSYPWILKYSPKKLLMYYGSNLTWGTHGKKNQLIHTIKIAVSNDGINWKCTNKVPLKFLNKKENALARPCVIKDAKKYKMWFSCKTKTYQIKYAESTDGYYWHRIESTKPILKNKLGWASKSIEYPCVFKALSKIWMLYNGNGYGKTGFGLAILE